MRGFAVPTRVEVTIQRSEIALGEFHIEPFHPCAILEHMLLNRDAYREGDPLVQRREVSEPA
ncbi:hypothetical protein NJBCHELONAE_03690 [Mycobacteroides chelonae]|nr:hypothetical protein NJBCHELONAE_03690 [Mycobacteroides chelonae]